ncbi:hypothetical protein PG984_004421 [Apiospora sp. TS-2023a]
MSSPHPQKTGDLEQDRQKDTDSPAGNVREEEAAHSSTEDTSSPAPQEAQTGDNKPIIGRPRPARSTKDGRRNAICGPCSQPWPLDPTTQAQGDNDNTNRPGSHIGDHPNPLGSNPVVITEQLAGILARENSPPPSPPPPPPPSPSPPRP